MASTALGQGGTHTFPALNFQNSFCPILTYSHESVVNHQKSAIASAWV